MLRCGGLATFSSHDRLVGNVLLHRVASWCVTRSHKPHKVCDSMSRAVAASEALKLSPSEVQTFTGDGFCLNLCRPSIDPFQKLQSLEMKVWISARKGQTANPERMRTCCR